MPIIPTFWAEINSLCSSGSLVSAVQPSHLFLSAAAAAGAASQAIINMYVSCTVHLLSSI